ncbi:MAG: thiamine pyrophosphate-dependent enzyme, partial [Myxococcota bacterium]
TAAAHYLPALMEASATRLPLVVLTANRPPELHGTAANQTTAQEHLFGRYVRVFVDLGVGDAPAAKAALRQGAQAAAAARHPLPGPVHLDLRARKPLEPGATPAEPGAPPRHHLPVLTPSPGGLAAFAADCAGAERGVLAAGPQRVTPALREAAMAFVQATGFTLLADVTSGLRGLPGAVPGFDALLKSDGGREALAADVLVQLGAPPVGAGWLRYAAVPRSAFWTLGTHPLPDRFPDAGGAATDVLVGEPAAALRAACDGFEPPALTGPEAAEAPRGERLRALLEREAARLARPYGEAHVARAAVDALPAGGALVLGNSLPVRLADAFAPPKDVRVVSQRGVSGIDGLIAGAAGFATATKTPTLLLLGDVAALHDVGALVLAARATTPLVVLVVDNAGGRIFDLLPVRAWAEAAGRGAERERFFAMAGAPSLEGAARMAELPYVRCDGAEALAKALADALARPGASLVHARVAPESGVTALRALEGAAAEGVRGS